MQNMKTRPFRLAATNYTICESMQGALLKSAMSKAMQYTAVTVSIKMLTKNEVSQNFMSNTFTQKHERRKS